MSSDLASFVNGTSGADVRTLLNILITRQLEVVNVKDRGAVGDGVTDDTAAVQDALNFAYGTTGSPHGDPSATSNRPVVFPNGTYKITAPLTIRSAHGAWLMGYGRLSTKIVQATPNASCFVTNGFAYSRVEGMSISTNGSGVAFDLDWDNTGTVALQANSFSDILFGGNSNTNGIGLRIGFTGYQGSENKIENCHFGVLGTGLQTANFNALQNTVVGGNFQDCNYGIKVSSGSVPFVSSTGFQVMGSYDVQIDGGTNADAMTLMNCRTESVNFVAANLGAPIRLIGCGQTQAAAGDFLKFIGPATVESCYSLNGRIYSPANNAGALYGFGNKFDRAAWLQNNQASVTAALTQGFLASRLLTDSGGNLVGATFASLPAAGPTNFGALVPVYDSSTAIAGATITGGGANKVLAYSNGTNWIVK